MNKELDIAEKNQPQNVEMERFSHARILARRLDLPGLSDYSLVFTEDRNRARTTCHIKTGAEINIRLHKRLGS